MKISKFLFSTLVAAAAMTSTVFAEGTTLYVGSSVTENPGTTFSDLKSAIQATKELGGSANLIFFGETPIDASGVDFCGTFVLSGSASFDRKKENVLIGYSSGDAEVTVGQGAVLDFCGADTQGIIVSDAKADGTRHHGTFVVNDATVKTNYFVNRHITKVSGNGVSYADVANLSSSNGFYIGSREFSESGDNAVATVTLEKKAFIDASGTNTVLVGYEGAGVLVVDDSKFIAKRQAVFVQDGSRIELRNGGIFEATTIDNNGVIAVSGNSTVDAKISGAGLFQITDGTLTLDKGVETKTFIIGKSGFVAAESDAGAGAMVTVAGENKITGTGDTATWVGLANDTDWSADNKGSFVLNVTGKDTKWDGGSTHVANAGQLNITHGAYAELTYTKVRGGLTVDASSVDINSQMNVYGEENYADGDPSDKSDVLLSNADFKVLNGSTVAVSGSLTIGKNNNANRVGTVTVDRSELSVGGTITVYAGSAIKVGEGSALTAGTITNNGTVEVGEGSMLTASVITGTGDIVLAGTLDVDSLTADELTIVVGDASTTPALMLLVAEAENESSISFNKLTVVADDVVAGLDLSTILESKVGIGMAEAIENAVAEDSSDFILQNSEGLKYEVATDEDGNVKVGALTPEPSAFGLLAGLGAIALAVSRRRRSR